MTTSFQNPLFIDIETVSSVSDYSELSPRMQACWLKKSARWSEKLEEQKSSFRERGGIFAEFGRVVVIAMGYIKKGSRGEDALYVKSLANDDERALLEAFKADLAKFPPNLQVCAHNGKEFDFPYLARRMTVHGIPLPAVLDTAGKKPWEVNHLDTMELWKFGDHKQYTSLELLASLFDIPSSKDDMQGNEVNTYYYEKKDLPAIARYCIKDVVVTVQVFRKLKMLSLIAAKDIHTQEMVLKKPLAEGPKNKLPLLDL